MASSQVEMASSSSAFGGCVLTRDHNRCATDNLKDYLHSDNISNRTLFDLHADWLPPIHFDDKNNVSNNDGGNHRHYRKRSRIVDRWAKAREMVFPPDKHNHMPVTLSRTTSNSTSTYRREGSPTQYSDSSVEVPNLGAVSSLVRKWRDLADARKNVKRINNNNVAANSTVNSSPISSRSNSGSLLTEHSGLVDDRSEPPTLLMEDTFPDWESDRTAPSRPPSCRSKDSDAAAAAAAERERIRVADIIRKLTSEEQAGLPRIRTRSDQQQLAFTPAIGSPRIMIRGRQAFTDLLMQMERDKQRELEGLVEQKPVSRFSYKGRIQALLRVRFLRRGAETKSHRRTISKTLEANRLNIRHLRDKFSAGNESRAAESRSRNRETVKKAPDAENPSTSTRVREVVDNTTNAEIINATRIIEMVHLPEIADLRCPSNKIHHQEASGSRSPHRSAKAVHFQESSNSTSPLFEIHHHESDDARGSQRELIDTTPDVDRCSTSMGLEENLVDQRTFLVEDSEKCHEGAYLCIHSDMCQGHQDSAQEQKLVNVMEERVHGEDSLVNVQKLTGPDHDWVNEISHIPNIWEDNDPSTNRILESCHEWISVFTQTRSDWDEQEFNDQKLLDANYGWISDIARPRSDWEGLRQARYQEMLDPFSENGEIRQLLERRSVSNFLSSDMRERIDQIMVCRAQRQPLPIDIQVERIERVPREEGQVREEAMGVVAKDRNSEECRVDIENVNNLEADKDDDDESRIEQQCSEYSEDDIDETMCSLPPHSPSLKRSWSRNGDNEVSDFSDQFASPCLQPSISSTPYSQGNPQCSTYRAHPSIEMEFIYDLRGYMEQLHQEILEIRNSIKSCVNMQVKLQRSIKQEVAAAVSHSVRRERKESTSRVPGRHSCCVCREMQVDSLFYRCGHMCACFKCARDLQWSSGKCPICQSPIIDVVRAYAHESS